VICDNAISIVHPFNNVVVKMRAIVTMASERMQNREAGSRGKLNDNERYGSRERKKSRKKCEIEKKVSRKSVLVKYFSRLHLREKNEEK
jgi:hypothetical protein